MISCLILSPNRVHWPIFIGRLSPPAFPLELRRLSSTSRPPPLAWNGRSHKVNTLIHSSQRASLSDGHVVKLTRDNNAIRSHNLKVKRKPFDVAKF